MLAIYFNSNNFLVIPLLFTLIELQGPLLSCRSFYNFFIELPGVDGFLMSRQLHAAQ